MNKDDEKELYFLAKLMLIPFITTVIVALSSIPLALGMIASFIGGAIYALIVNNKKLHKKLHKIELMVQKNKRKKK